MQINYYSIYIEINAQGKIFTAQPCIKRKLAKVKLRLPVKLVSDLKSHKRYIYIYIYDNM